MIGYKFSLQNVLDWRNDQEDEAKLKLVQLKNILKKEEYYLQQLINENIQLKEKAVLVSKVDVMRQHDLYKEVLNEKIIRQKLIVEQAVNETKKAEEALLTAHKDKKVMEKLKEKEYEKQKEILQTEEQKQIDEFSTITYRREAFQ